ncbi:MAG: TRAP transporter fused permease subunit [Desulfarculus sp.]|jgi:TRAP transporter 4TM/12TM fusion protein|nr:MAG: TRAP transporter fused permease subunit [Desulfarculus sp.]
MRLQKLDLMIAMVAIGMGLYHMANCYYSIVGTIEHRMIHLAFALTLIFLAAIKPKKTAWVYALLIAASLGAIGYLWINLQRLLFDMGFPLAPDVVVGFVVLFVVFTACWLSFGYILPLMAVLLLLYGFFGHYLGGPVLSTDEIITTVALTFGSYDLWGTILVISANVIFLFVFFGGLLGSLKATDFFVELGKVVGKYSRSGPAMTAVVSSLMMGMTTGQATPNIAVTGAFTIPLMKRVGYRPEVAASIEAAASGGSQIMPPIMGAGAFVMADLLGVPYATIIMMAAIPGILYFSSVAFFVHFHAIKSKVQPLPEQVDIGRLIATGPLFMIPITIILVLFYLGFPPMLAAFWGIGALILLSFLRKKNRPTLSDLLKGCIAGATTGAKVAVACATLGPIIALVTKTGLGLTVGYSVEAWAHGSLFWGLLILAGAVIILGLEVPTVAAYLIAAMMAIPALVRMGLEPMQAHMFAFYFGAFSALTPPVGMAAIVASRIAGAPYIRTAFHSINAAIAGFLIPFVFAYNGALLLLPDSSLMEVLLTICAVLVGLGIFQVGFVGCLVERLTMPERTMAIISGIGLIVFAASSQLVYLGGGLVLLAAVVVLNLLKKKKMALSLAGRS